MHASIFNEVLGPVMRGPSSSHTAASWRIGMTGRALLGEPLASALVEFDREGAWATNYREQGTVIGMDGGLLAIDITDERIIDTAAVAAEQGVSIEYRVSRFPTDHPNTVRLHLSGRAGGTLSLTAVSLGGGMFDIRVLQGLEVTMGGDYHELVAFARHEPAPGERTSLEQAAPERSVVRWSAGAGAAPASAAPASLVQIKSPEPFSSDFVAWLRTQQWVASVAVAPPILPVVSGRERGSPFSTVAELLDYAATRGASLGELGELYEQNRSGLPAEDVQRMMRSLVEAIERSIQAGLAGTHYEDRILPRQSHLVHEAERQGHITPEPVVNRLIENITAIMESKSAMQVIVAAPTAGGCGALGGTITAVADQRGCSRERKIGAYFAAGMIGVFIAEGPGFSAEAGGCQLECGAAAAMTAAALVDLSGGSAAQAVAAASMALQNMIGLVCDPVADRVEVPCLGKNVSAGMNALSSSVMALSGFDPVVPLDQVIQTVESVAAGMSPSLCCTGLGGLAATDTSRELKEMLARRCAAC